jgi:hypothetical protein
LKCLLIRNTGKMGQEATRNLNEMWLKCLE